MKSDELRESSKLFSEGLQGLRNQCRKKEQQLEPSRKRERSPEIDSIAATSEPERKQREQTDSEIKQLKEKQDVLQNLLRKKELLFKAKCDEFLSSSESFTN